MRQIPHPTRRQITLTGVLAALSDPARLAIAAVLADGRERGWGDVDVCGVGPSTLSHHLRVLREAGVIRHRKAGTRCFVSLRADLDEAFPGLLGSVLKFAGRPANRRRGRPVHKESE